jgi:hypothetical protein
MRIGRFLLPLAAVTGVALLSLAPAGAEEYPPEEPTLTLSAGTVVVGNSVTLTGSGFDPGEEITIGVSYDPAMALRFPPDGADEAEPIAAALVARSVPALAALSATADADGDFSATVTLTETGRATITVTGQTSGLSGSVVVTVVADADALPTTGSSAGGLIWTGVALIGGGSFVLLGMLLVRRHRRTETRTPVHSARS